LAMNEAIVERVRQAHVNAVSLMQRSGFYLNNLVEIVVDAQLPFMGYTVPQGQGFRIVVSGAAVESEMLEGLLVHEMSHIYRMQTNHPSHNHRLIEDAINGLGMQALSTQYQRRAISELVNNIQDLYADDIAMKALREGNFPDGQLSSFFQSWVKDQPVRSTDSKRDRWVNAAIMANNARTLAQMKRHKILDVGGRAQASNEKLLRQLPAAASRPFSYFMSLMVNLKEDMTEEEYRSLLQHYLHTFLEITESS
jgi:hypothetical protein